MHVDLSSETSMPGATGGIITEIHPLKNRRHARIRRIALVLIICLLALTVGLIAYRFTGGNASISKQQAHSGFVWCVAYSPNGNVLASGGSDGMLKLWDSSSFVLLREVLAHEYNVRCLAFSPDGMIIATGSVDRRIRLWNASTLDDIGILRGHTKAIYALAFSPDGSLLATGGMDGTLRVWDVRSKTVIQELSGKNFCIESLAFSPNGKMVFSSGLTNDSSPTPIEIWEIDTGKSAGVLSGHTSIVRTLACSPDGTMLGSGGTAQTVFLWDLSTCELLSSISTGRSLVSCIAFSSDSKALAIGTGTAMGDGEVRFWSLTLKADIGMVQLPRGEVWSIAYSKDDKMVAAGCSDGSIVLIDVSLATK